MAKTGSPIGIDVREGDLGSVGEGDASEAVMHLTSGGRLGAPTSVGMTSEVESDLARFALMLTPATAEGATSAVTVSAVEKLGEGGGVAATVAREVAVAAAGYDYLDRDDIRTEIACGGAFAADIGASAKSKMDGFSAHSDAAVATVGVCADVTSSTATDTVYNYRVNLDLLILPTTMTSPTGTACLAEGARVAMAITVVPDMQSTAASDLASLTAAVPPSCAASCMVGGSVDVSTAAVWPAAGVEPTTSTVSTDGPLAVDDADDQRLDESQTPALPTASAGPVCCTQGCLCAASVEATPVVSGDRDDDDRTNEELARSTLEGALEELLVRAAVSDSSLSPSVVGVGAGSVQPSPAQLRAVVGSATPNAQLRDQLDVRDASLELAGMQDLKVDEDAVLNVQLRMQDGCVGGVAPNAQLRKEPEAVQVACSNTCLRLRCSGALGVHQPECEDRVECSPGQPASPKQEEESPYWADSQGRRHGAKVLFVCGGLVYCWERADGGGICFPGGTMSVADLFVAVTLCREVIVEEMSLPWFVQQRLRRVVAESPLGYSRAQTRGAGKRSHVVHVWAMQVSAHEASHVLPTALGIAESTAPRWRPIGSAVTAVRLPQYRAACLAALGCTWSLPVDRTFAQLEGTASVPRIDCRAGVEEVQELVVSILDSLVAQAVLEGSQLEVAVESGARGVSTSWLQLMACAAEPAGPAAAERRLTARTPGVVVTVKVPQEAVAVDQLLAQLSQAHSDVEVRELLAPLQEAQLQLSAVVGVAPVPEAAQVDGTLKVRRAQVSQQLNDANWRVEADGSRQLLFPDGVWVPWHRVCESEVLATHGRVGEQGVIASKSFKEGDVVMVVVGEPITAEEYWRRRDLELGDMIIEFNDQLYDMRGDMRGACYINTSKGLGRSNNVRFCNPAPGASHVTVRAMVSIKDGAELFAGYGSAFWDYRRRVELGMLPERPVPEQPSGRDSDSVEEDEAVDSAPCLKLGCRVEFAAALCDLVGTCQMVQGVWEDTDRDMAMVRLDAEAHQVERVDGDVKRFQAVWLVVVPVTELRFAAVAASRAEDASTNGGLDADAVAAVLERVGLGLEPPDPVAQSGAARLGVQIADRAPPPLPVRTLGFSLCTACMLVGEDMQWDDSEERDPKTLQTSLDGVAWWAARLVHDLPAAAGSELRLWAEGCRVSLAAFVIRPEEAHEAVELLALRLVDLFRDTSVEVLEGLRADGNEACLEAADGVLELLGGGVETLLERMVHAEQFARAFDDVWFTWRQALAPRDGQKMLRAVIELARVAALLGVAGHLVQLAARSEELQAMLPPLVLDVRRHLRAPTPSCERRPYTARHVGAARYLQRAFRQATLRFEALEDAHPFKRSGPAQGAAWYEEKVADREVEINPGWQPGVLRHVLLPWKAEPRATRCGRGANLASQQLFDKQRAHADGVLQTGAFYVRLYELLEGLAPMGLVLGCRDGGANEGIARLGGRHLGVDNKPQPGFIEKFGADRFRLADVIEGAAGISVLMAQPGVVSVFITIDCQLYSTINLSGIAGHESQHKQLIPSCSEVAGLAVDLGKEVCCENTRGASGVMADTFPHVMSLRGDLFALRTSRPRIWGSAPTPLSSESLQGATAKELHAGMCNGQWRIMPHLDAHGKPDKVPCCRGNTVPLHGKCQPRLPIGLLCETAGLAPDAMDWQGLTQAVPAAYAAFVFGQQVKAWLERHRSMPCFPFGSRASLDALQDWADGLGLGPAYSVLLEDHFQQEPAYVLSSESAGMSDWLDELDTDAHHGLSCGPKSRVWPGGEATQGVAATRCVTAQEHQLLALDFKCTRPYVALVALQAAVRRRSARRKLQLARVLRHAAVRVQRAWRGESTRIALSLICAEAAMGAEAAQPSWLPWALPALVQAVLQPYLSAAMQTAVRRRGGESVSSPPTHPEVDAVRQGQQGGGGEGGGSPSPTGRAVADALMRMHYGSEEASAAAVSPVRLAAVALASNVMARVKSRVAAKVVNGESKPSGEAEVPRQISEDPSSAECTGLAARAVLIQAHIQRLEEQLVLERQWEAEERSAVSYDPPMKLAAAQYTDHGLCPPSMSSLSQPSVEPPGAVGFGSEGAETVAPMTHRDKISLLAANAGVLTPGGDLHRCDVVLDFGSVISGLSRAALQRILDRAAPGAVLFKQFDQQIGLGVEGVGGAEVMHVGNALIDLYVEGRLFRVPLPVLEGGELFILGMDFLKGRLTELDVERQLATFKHCPDGKECSKFVTPALTNLDSYYAHAERTAMRACVQQVAATQDHLAYAHDPVKLKPWSQKGLKLRLPLTIEPGSMVLIERMGDSGPNRTIARVAEGLYEVKVRGEVVVSVCNPSLSAHTFISDMEPLARVTVGPEECVVDQADLSLDELMDLLKFGDHLSEAEVNKFRPHLAARLHYFSMKRIGRYHGAEVAIHTPKIDSGEVPPPFVGARRLPPEQYVAARAEFDKLVAIGILTPSKGGGYGSPIVMVKKPKGDGKGGVAWRMACDYRNLNALSTRDCYTLPNPVEALAALGKANFISAVDCSMAFHQLPLREQDKEKTCVSFPWGGFVFETMPFGLAGATSAFQRTVDMVLSGLTWTGEGRAGICMGYVDDCIIYTCGDIDQHVEDVMQVIDRFGMSGFILKPSKCTFAMLETEWLGHLCLEGGTAVVAKKVSAINDIAPDNVLESKKMAKRFVMMAQYYARFIPDYAAISGPLHALGGGSAASFKGRASSLKIMAAVAALKHALTTAPVLMRPDFNKQMHLEVDTATRNGIGAVLSQEDDEGNVRPIAYWARAFAEGAPEKHWGITQSEVNGMVESLQHFKAFIHLAPGSTVVATDHESLQYLFTCKTLSGVMARYALQLSDFDIQIVYRAGSLMVISDALSRLCKAKQQAQAGGLQQGDAAGCGEAEQARASGLQQGMAAGSEEMEAVASDLQQGAAAAPLAVPQTLWQQARTPRAFSAVNLLVLSPNLSRVVVVNSGGTARQPQALPRLSVSRQGTMVVDGVSTLAAQSQQLGALNVSWREPLDLLYLGDEAFAFYALAPSDVRLLGGGSLSMVGAEELLDKAPLLVAPALQMFLRLWQLAEANGDAVLPRAAVPLPQAAAVAKQTLPLRRLVSVAVLRGAEAILVESGSRVQLPGCKVELRDMVSLARAAVEVLGRVGIAATQAAELVEGAVRVSARGAHQVVVQLPAGSDVGAELPPGAFWAPLHSMSDRRPTAGRAVDLSLLQEIYLLHQWKALQPNLSSLQPKREELEVYLNTCAEDGGRQPLGSTWSSLNPGGETGALNIVARGEFFLADSAPRCRTALRALWKVLTQMKDAGVELRLSLDLEGPLRERGRIDVLQVAVGEWQMGFDLTCSAGLQALDEVPDAWGTCALRSMLEDASIVKVVHSGGCDALALWTLYGIRLQGCWDTCTADVTLEPQIEGRFRGLAAVLKAWLSVEMSEKSNIEHDDDLWRRRPLTEQQLCYVAEDVTSSEALYDAQLVVARAAGVEYLIRETSQRYWQSLPAEGALVALAVVDEQHVALRESAAGLELAMVRPVAPEVFGQGSTIHLAQGLWTSLMRADGPKPPRGLKGVRLGSVMLHVATLADDQLQILRSDGGPLEAEGLVLVAWSQLRAQMELLDSRSCACLEHLLRLRELARAVDSLQAPLAHMAAVMSTPQHAARHASMIVHDDTHALAFDYKAEGQTVKAFPKQAYQHGFEGSVIARLALQNKLGPVEERSGALHAAAERCTRLGRFGENNYFSMQVPDLKDLWIDLYSAWQARDCTQTERNAWVAFQEVQLGAAVGTLGSAEDAAAMATLYQRQMAARLARQVGTVAEQPSPAMQSQRQPVQAAACTSAAQEKECADAPREAKPSPRSGEHFDRMPSVLGVEFEIAADDDEVPVVPDAGVATDRMPGMAPGVSHEMMRAHQWADAYCRKWLEQLSEQSEETCEIAKGRDLYSMHRGVLYHATRGDVDTPVRAAVVVVPVTLRDSYMRAFHDRLAHVGVARSATALREHAWWPALRKAVRAYIRRCPTCTMVQRTRVQAGQARTLGNGDHPADAWVVDVLTLPESPEGYCKVIVFIDRFSRYVAAEAFKEDPSAVQVIECFVRLIVKNHGFPRAVISDRGSNLIAAVVKDYYSAVGVAMIASDSYMHNTAGLVERFMDTLKDALRSYLFDTGSDSWQLYMDYAVLSYNATVQSRMGLSPFYVLYGRDARFPVDLALLPPYEAREAQMGSYAKEHAHAIFAAWQTARQALAKSASVERAAANASRDLGFTLQEGDRVVIRKPNYVGLEVPYHGPYRVSQVLDCDRVQVRDLHRVMHDEFHISKLKLYPYVDNDGNIAADSDEYLVEDVIAKRVENGMTQYKIKWVGWGKTHAVFMDVDTLTPQVLEYVEAYEARVAVLEGRHLEGAIVNSITDTGVANEVPAIRSHAEQQREAAPASFTPDRTAAPEASTAKRGGGKVAGKGQGATVSAEVAPEELSVPPAPTPATVVDERGEVHKPVVKDTADAALPVEQRTTRSGTTQYNL